MARPMAVNRAIKRTRLRALGEVGEAPGTSPVASDVAHSDEQNADRKGKGRGKRSHVGTPKKKSRKR